MSENSILTAAINRLYRQVLLMIGRGRLTLTDDSGVVQYDQVRLGENELRDNVPNVQQYGFSSNPPVGTDAILAFIAGDRSNGCIIATNNQTYRIKNLMQGGVAVYDMYGNKIIMDQTGIRLNSPISFASDVNGYGQRITYNGGASWTIDSYTIGATVTTNSHAINPPEIP